REGMARILPEEIYRAYSSLPPEKQAQMPYEMFSAIAWLRAKDVYPRMHADMADITPFIQNLLRVNLDKHIGALSLSETDDSVLMWSHYSSGHTGFVLGFDARHSYFNARLAEVDEFRHLRRVEYRNERPNAALSTLSGVEMFLVKNTDWAREKEWRIMRPLADAESVITIDTQPFPVCLFRYPSDAIREIIFGAKMTPSMRRVLFEVLEAQPALRHVVLKQAIVDRQTYCVRVISQSE
ncbi:MAG: DUF2971 domain-containing protein, partial [Actinomycetota bacterium]|nr:DUF2971 domain-containing protein [Actinomycetota bacterium]